MLLVLALALKHQADQASPQDQALMPPADFATASPAQQKQEIDAAINGYLGSQGFGSSLLQTKQAKGDKKWDESDNVETEDMMKKSYQDIDHVQDSLIKAANKELEEQKNLPTIEQATTSWKVFNDAVAAAEQKDGLPSSFAQTGGVDMVGGIDFGKIDEYERDFSKTEADEKQQLANVEQQMQQDEAFAKRVQESQQRSAQASQLEMQHEERAKEHYLLSKHYERAGEHKKAHAHSMGHTMEKLAAVNQRVAILEHSMLVKAQQLGMKPTEAKALFKRLDTIRAMSNAAREIMGAGKEPNAQRAKDLLALRQQIGAQTKSLVHDLELSKHKWMQQAMRRGKRLGESFVQDEAPGAESMASDFDQVTSHADAITNKIKKEIQAMKAQGRAEDRAKLQALEASPSTSPNAFNFDLPASYTQTNELRRD